MDRELGQDEVSDRLVRIADGVYVEQDVLNIVEKIQQYDPNLKVKYCDPDRAEFGDEPYRIVEICPDGMERVVFGTWTLDERVMDRLYAADNLKTDVLANIDRNNRLVELEMERRYTDKKLEANDIMTHYFNSRKGRWSFVNDAGQKVTIDDQEGRKAKIE
jgi:hypothetical protein